MMAAYDALCVMGIFEGRMERLQLLAPFALVEMPTIPVLVELQCTGFVVEKKPFQALKNDVEKLLNDLNRLAIDEGVPPDYREQMEQSGTKRENGGMSLGSHKFLKELVVHRWDLHSRCAEYYGTKRMLGGGGGRKQTSMERETLQMLLNFLHAQHKESKESQKSSGSAKRPRRDQDAQT